MGKMPISDRAPRVTWSDTRSLEKKAVKFEWQSLTIRSFVNRTDKTSPNRTTDSYPLILLLSESWPRDQQLSSQRLFSLMFSLPRLAAARDWISFSKPRPTKAISGRISVDSFLLSLPFTEIRNWAHDIEPVNERMVCRWTTFVRVQIFAPIMHLCCSLWVFTLGFFCGCNGRTWGKCWSSRSRWHKC